MSGLRHYQLDAVDWLHGRTAAHKNSLLADEMGIGKSASALSAIQTPRAIVVCPASLCRNWKLETSGPLSIANGAPITGWRPDFSVRLVKSSKPSEWIPASGEMVIGSWDSLPRQIDSHTLLDANLSNVTVILDEVHYAKNERAKRTRKARALVRQAFVTYGLSGTPLKNRPEDLYGVLETLGLEEETFGSWSAFVKLLQGWQDNYGNWKFGRWDCGVLRIDEDRLAKAAELLAPVMLRRLKCEVLSELPPKVYVEEVVEIAPPRDSAAVIREAGEKWSVYVKQKRTESGGVASDELPPFEILSGAMTELAKAKIPAMTEFVERHEEAEVPLLVFSAHVEPIRVLSGREGWGVIHGGTTGTERARVVEAFQAGQLKGVGLTIGAGGVGLTLAHASNVLRVDRAWNPSDNLQAEDRAHRLGQKGESVTITDLIADHELDRRLTRLLLGKARTNKAVVG